LWLRASGTLIGFLRLAPATFESLFKLEDFLLVRIPLL
jgi:hypothetical protein